jgi:hypothetical protein
VTVQTSYSNQAKAFAGQIMGKPGRHRTVLNDGGSVRQIDDVVLGTVPPVAQAQLLVTPGAPNNSTLYRVVINGVNCDYTTDGTATQAELRDGIRGAIAAAVGTAVSAVVAGNDVQLTAVVPGVPFTISIAAGPAAPLTLGAATPNTGDGTVYSFSVNGFPVSYTARRQDTIINVRDGLCIAARAVRDLEGVVYVNPSGSNVRVTAAQPGVGYTITESDTRLSTVSVQANGTGAIIPFGRAVVRRAAGGGDSAQLPSGAGQSLMGFSIREHTVVPPLDAGQMGIKTLGIGNALELGLIVVESEEDLVDGDQVYFRHTANGALNVMGRIRNDADSATCDIATGCRVRGNHPAGLAVIAVNLPQ